jgi:hypothetical protein
MSDVILWGLIGLVLLVGGRGLIRAFRKKPVLIPQASLGATELLHEFGEHFLAEVQRILHQEILVRQVHPNSLTQVLSIAGISLGRWEGIKLTASPTLYEVCELASALGVKVIPKLSLISEEVIVRRVFLELPLKAEFIVTTTERASQISKKIHLVRLNPDTRAIRTLCGCKFSPSRGKFFGWCGTRGRGMNIYVTQDPVLITCAHCLGRFQKNNPHV